MDQRKGVKNKKQVKASDHMKLEPIINPQTSYYTNYKAFMTIYIDRA